VFLLFLLCDSTLASNNVLAQNNLPTENTTNKNSLLSALISSLPFVKAIRGTPEDLEEIESKISPKVIEKVHRVVIGNNKFDELLGLANFFEADHRFIQEWNLSRWSIKSDPPLL